MGRPALSKPKKQLFNRAQIVEYAARMFMEHGYASTSIDMIARSMGCTKGYIYNYFESKVEIYFSIHRQAMENVISAVSPIFSRDESARSKLEAMCQAHMNLIVEETHFSRVSILGLEMHVIERTAAKERSELRQIGTMRDRYEQMYTEVIAGGVEDGVFRKCNPKIVAKALLGSLNWTVLWYNPQERLSKEATRRTVREVLDYVLLGVVQSNAAVPNSSG